MNLFQEIVMFASLGGAVGVLSALLGIGGGIVIVPALSIIFKIMGFPAESVMRFAAGTSLCVMVFTSTASMLAHQREGNVAWEVFRRFAPGLVVGTILGVLISRFVHAHWASAVFGVLMLALSVKMLIGFKHRTMKRVELPSKTLFAGVGVIVGGVSGFLGISGGSLGVPLLGFFGVSMRRAVGTAAAVSVPIALSGAVMVLITGRGVTNVAGATGYAYWPAVVGVAPFCLITAPVGAALSKKLHGKTLRRIFAVLLLVVGVKMICEMAFTS